MGDEGHAPIYRWSGRWYFISGVVVLVALAGDAMASDDLSRTGKALPLCAMAAYAVHRAWSRPFAIRVSEEAIELVYLLRRVVVVPRGSALVDEVTGYLWGTRICLRDNGTLGRRRLLIDTEYSRRPVLRSALISTGYEILDRTSGRVAAR